MSLHQETLQNRKGTYVLVMESKEDIDCKVGRYGILNVHPGYYVYVGSAFGPGGIRTRVCRHLKDGKKMHWHIDYLSKIARISEVWYLYDKKCYEHLWARVFSSYPGVYIPLYGFGSSDCRCLSHLFFFKSAPSSKKFFEKVKETGECEGLINIVTL